MSKGRIKTLLRFGFNLALGEIRSSIKNPKKEAAAREAAQMAVKYAREFADSVESEFLS